MEVRRLDGYTSRELSTVCDWMHAWWGVPGGYTKEEICAYLSRMVCPNRIPQTYAAYVGGEIAGTYNLSMEDLFVRPDLYPWLCNLYVAPQYRGKGVGRALIESIPRAMADIGLKELYLYTAHEGLYEKFGWEYVGPIRTFDKGQDIQRLYVLRV